MQDAESSAIEAVKIRLRENHHEPTHDRLRSWILIVQKTGSTELFAYVPIPFDADTLTIEQLSTRISRIMCTDVDILMFLRCHWCFVLCGEKWSSQMADELQHLVKPYFREDDAAILLLENL